MHPDPDKARLIELAAKEWHELDRRARRDYDDPEEAAHAIGLRDGFERAVQIIDMLTGGDGEYRYCTNHDPERHCPTPVEMMRRIEAAALKARAVQP